MWWKLTALGIVTIGLIFAIIPIKTHAVLYDPARDPPPRSPSFWNMLGGMYLTPGTILAAIVILLIAGFVASKIIKGAW
jgi:vacuolar-type H+-ATPase subunit I/STV1